MAEAGTVEEEITSDEEDTKRTERICVYY